MELVVAAIDWYHLPCWCWFCYDLERLAERLADAALGAGLYEPGR